MINNNYSGKFIVIEGLDGSGQSTQVSRLRDFLYANSPPSASLRSASGYANAPMRIKKYDVVTTKEPTMESEAGKRIRKVLDKEIKEEPARLQELYTQDRKEHLENLIIPALKQGKIVISDRYFFSTFAYGASEGLDLEWLIKINDNFLLPDLTFILQVRPEICISRIEGRGEPKTLFERQEKLAKVWETYELLPARFENVKVIDGEKSIEDVFADVKKVVLSHLNIGGQNHGY